jgi:hypothetical protein
MSKKQRNTKHGVSEQKKSGIKIPSSPGKLYWTDGYWTDPRWSIDTSAKVASQIRRDWEDLEWVKQTDWYKEHMAKDLLEKH